MSRTRYLHQLDVAQSLEAGVVGDRVAGSEALLEEREDPVPVLVLAHVVERVVVVVEDLLRDQRQDAAQLRLDVLLHRDQRPEQPRQVPAAHSLS